MTEPAKLDETPPAVSVSQRGPHRALLIGGMLVAVVLAVAAVVGAPFDRDGASPALLDDVDPRTAAFVGHHDEVTDHLDHERALVADQEPSPDRLHDLAAALEATRRQYAAEAAPSWLEADVADYLAAVESEQAALLEAYDTLQSGDDPREALQHALDARHRAENLVSSLRGTAILHPAGR